MSEEKKIINGIDVDAFQEALQIVGANPEASRKQLSALFQQLVVPEGVRMETVNIPALVMMPGERG